MTPPPPSETAEEMADRLRAEVAHRVLDVIEMVESVEGPLRMSREQRDAFDLGVEASYLATLQVLVANNLLPSTSPGVT